MRIFVGWKIYTVPAKLKASLAKAHLQKTLIMPILQNCFRMSHVAHLYERTQDDIKTYTPEINDGSWDAIEEFLIKHKLAHADEAVFTGGGDWERAKLHGMMLRAKHFDFNVIQSGFRASMFPQGTPFSVQGGKDSSSLAEQQLIDVLERSKPSQLVVTAGFDRAKGTRAVRIDDCPELEALAGKLCMAAVVMNRVPDSLVHADVESSVGTPHAYGKVFSTQMRLG